MENPHGQRSLVGYSPLGHEDLDMTEATKHSTAHKHSTKSVNSIPQMHESYETCENIAAQT